MNLQSKADVITDKPTDKWTDDPIIRCPRQTFQVKGINNFKNYQLEIKIWSYNIPKLDMS